MKTIFNLPLLLFFLFLSLRISGQDNYYKLEIEIEHRSQLEDLTRRVSIDNVIDNRVIAYANAKQFKALKATSYTYKILPLEERGNSKAYTMATTLAEMSDWDAYPTYQVYLDMMEQFTLDYPNLCKLDTIGESEQGRLLLALKISDNVEENEAEPEFFYTGTMHGDETAGFVLLLRLADSLLTSYGSSDRITRLVDSLQIYINPAANPDGTYYGGNTTITGARRYNSNGVDINRNFPDPEDGTNPDGNSHQAETIAMMEFAEHHDFVMSANFHGGAEVANYPWDTWSRSHVDDGWFVYASHVYADSAMDNSPAGYFTSVSSNGVTNGYDWYTVSGSRQDYMNFFHQCREITMEISNQKLLNSEELPDHWIYNKAALLAYMELASYGIQGLVKNEAGDPVQAKIIVEGHDADIDSSMVFSDSNTGHFTRLIDPGTYTLQVSAFGYKTKTIEGVNVEREKLTKLDVTLETIYKLAPSVKGISAYGDVIDTLDKSFSLANVYSEALNYQIQIENNSSAENWIEITPTSGSISANGSEKINLSFNSNGFEEDYSCQLLISLVGEEEDTTVSINFSTTYQPELYVEQEKIIDTLEKGESGIHELHIRNTGTGSATYDLSIEDAENNNWVSLANNGGTVEDETDSIEVVLSAEMLEAGKYNTYVLVNMDNKNSLRVPVELTVLETTNITGIEYSARVFPNPFESDITILLKGMGNQEDIHVGIYDMNGRLLLQKKYSYLQGKPLYLHTGKALNMKKGNFILRIESDSKVIVKQLIKL